MYESGYGQVASAPTCDQKLTPSTPINQVVNDLAKLVMEAELCTANTIHNLCGAMPEINKPDSDPKSILEAMLKLREHADRLMSLTHELAQMING